MNNSSISEKENHYKDYLPENRIKYEGISPKLFGFIAIFLFIIGIVFFVYMYSSGHNILSVDSRYYNLNLNESLDLDSVYSSSDSEVIWEANSDNVVIKNNVVTASKAGKAYILARVGNVQVSDVNITVLNEDNKLAILNHSINMKISELAKVSIIKSLKYKSGNTSSARKTSVYNNKGIVQNLSNNVSDNIRFINSEEDYVIVEGNFNFESSNKGVVSVDDNGNITPKGAGVAIVTVKDNDGNEDHTYVTVFAEDIILSNANYNVKVNDTVKIDYSLESNKYSINDIVWVSNNPSIVSVDNSGTVKALSVGKGVIEVSVGELKKKINFLVEQDVVLPSDLVVDKKDVVLEVGSDLSINASVLPDNATNKDVVYSSSNTSIATVDSSGKIIGKGLGKTVIVASTTNGIKRNINVTVTKKNVAIENATNHENFYSKESSVFYDGKVNTFSSDGIQTVIDSVKDTGGIIYLPTGVYKITKPIVLPAFVTLIGDGAEKTILRADGNISSVIETTDYTTFLNGTSKWHDTKGVPMQFGIKNISVDGNYKAINGVNIYGYSFIIRDVDIKSVSGNGMNISWGKDNDNKVLNDVWKDNYSKFFESYLDHIRVFNANNIGINWENLTDAYLDNIEVSNCNKGIRILGNNYVGRANIHNCSTGVEIVDNSSIADLSVDNCEIGLYANGWRLNVDKITCSGSKQYDMVFTSRAAHSLIRSYKSTSSPSGDYIKKDGDDIRIGNKSIGDTVETSKYVKSQIDVNFLNNINQVLDNAKKAASLVDSSLPIINVVDFGAKGTLVDDDTKAIQSAIDSLKSSGGVVYFPPGQYRINKKLLIYSNITIKGAGPHTSEFYLSDFSNPDSDGNKTDVTSMLETYGEVKNTRIVDISFFGNKYDNHNKNVAGLTIHGSNIVIDNVWVEGISGYGVYFGINDSEKTKYSYINGLRIRYGDNKGLIIDGGGKVAVDNTDVSECKDIGLDVLSPVVIGNIHLYSNYGNYQLLDRGGIVANTVISETAHETAFRLENSNTKIGTLQLYANHKMNLQKVSSASDSYIGTYQCNDPITTSDALDGSSYGKISVPWISKEGNYTIKYNANGGSGNVSDTICSYDTKCLFSKNTFNKLGYTLIKGKEWCTNADGSGTCYDQASQYNLSSLCNKDDDCNITLHANWENNHYKLVKSYGGNLISNGGFDDYTEVVSPSKKVNNLVHTWDNTLNGIPGKINKAYNAINWGTGFNGNVALPELGYHAHMRIIDNNKVFRFKTNEDYVNKTESDISGGSVKPGTITVGRWLGIAEIIDGSKLKAGETYMLTVDVYRVSGNNIVTGGLYYATTSSNGSLSFGAGKCSLSPSKAGAWESLSWTFTLGNDYSYAKANPKLYIYGNAGGAGELYVDNIKLEQVIISNKEYDTSYTNNDLASIDKLGYTFSGWYNNSSFDNILTNTTKFDNNSAMFDNIDNDGSNARIYARFVPNNYIVKYNANGGTGTMENTTCTYDKNCVLSTNTFTRKGYSFNGWSDNANGTKIYDDKANVNNLVSSGTKNLYAVWKPNTLTITYNANGGTDTKKTKAIPFSAVYKYDGTNFASGGLPNANGSATSGTWALTKPGYTITADWLVGSSTSSKVISANSNYATVQALATAIGYPIELKNQTVTLYAKWKSSLKIDKSNVILGKGKTIQLSAVNDVGESVTWTSSNTKVATVSKGLVTGVSRGIVTITIKAGSRTATCMVTVIDKNNYAIVYNKNGGAGTMNNTICTLNTNCKLSVNSYSRIGYTFDGWYTKASGGTKYGATMNETKNITVYAHWKINKYKITYNANGGKGSVSATTCNYMGDCTLRANSFTKVGYTFDGWYTKASGGTKYSTVTKLTGNTTIYAHWKANKVIVKYNANGGKIASESGLANNDEYSIKDGLIYMNSSVLTSKFDYGTIKDLANLNSKNYLNMGKSGYSALGGNEWCEKADGTGSCFDQDVKYDVSNYCDASKGDCTVTLYANWKIISKAVMKESFKRLVYKGDDAREYYAYAPSIMVKDGVVNVWYCGNKNKSDGTAASMTETTRDHIMYTSNNGRTRTNVLELVTGQWDEYHMCDPSVVEGNFYYNGKQYKYIMAYTGVDKTAHPYGNDIGLAVSNALNSGWIRVGTLPLISYDKADRWGTGQPSLIYKDNKLILFYTNDTGIGKGMQVVIIDPNTLEIESSGDLGAKNVFWLHNADFAFKGNKLYVAHEGPEHGGREDSNGDNVSNTIRIWSTTISDFTNIKSYNDLSWTEENIINEEISGYRRNTNVGLFRKSNGELYKRVVGFTSAYQGNNFGWFDFHIYQSNF